MNPLYLMKSGETTPGGWLEAQMKNDLSHGFVGHLPTLVPSLFEEDDIYGKDRRGTTITNLSMGLAQDEALNPEELQWWNSETQSQWQDGFIRHAYLLKDPSAIDRCIAYVEKICASADPDGYIGIYQENTRYAKKKESGELWAQATLFRALLSYYELTGDQKVLDAVIKAVDLTIAKYHDESPLFSFEQTHGLMFSDVLDALFKRTGDYKYAEYLEYLYEQLSQSECSIGDDVARTHVLDPAYRLDCHGVHTYEHLRALTSLAYMTGKPEYHDLLKKYEAKIERCICPSGGGIGDEWIHGHFADATKTGYEYCSIQELLHSYMFLLERTGSLSYADKIERIFLNAGQGARNPEESGIAYLKSDNSYAMEGGFHIEREDIPHKAQVRYKYSPTHQEAAVCCVPNAGRLATYYLQATWYKTEKGFQKTLYGASTLRTQWQGEDITITEKSQFPQNGSLTFVILCSAPVQMELRFRIPEWCDEYQIESGRSYHVDEGQIVFEGQWEKCTKLKIHFLMKFQAHDDLISDRYFTYGPMVLAMPIAAKKYVSRTYGYMDFCDVCYTPAEKIPDQLYICKDTLPAFHIVEEGTNWLQMVFETKLWDANQSVLVDIPFVPMGNTVLRKVTFPQSK